METTYFQIAKRYLKVIIWTQLDNCIEIVQITNDKPTNRDDTIDNKIS